MNRQVGPERPPVRTVCAFMPTVSTELAGIPGTVVDVWPRFRSGDYLVTLAYAKPVRLSKELVTHIDAFVSELRCDTSTARSE